jgi:hypothetical protein
MLLPGGERHVTAVKHHPEQLMYSLHLTGQSTGQTWMLLPGGELLGHYNAEKCCPGQHARMHTHTTSSSRRVFQHRLKAEEDQEHYFVASCPK